jgi:hypothetical protein
MKSEENRWHNGSEEGIWQDMHTTCPIRRSGEESDAGSINATESSGESSGWRKDMKTCDVGVSKKIKEARNIAVSGRRTFPLHTLKRSHNLPILTSSSSSQDTPQHQYPATPDPSSSPLFHSPPSKPSTFP